MYSSHISWSSATTPTPLELYPALAFDRLFRDEVGKADKSVLDAVREDATSYKNKVSTSDKRRLDEYLASVREVEQRIEQAEKMDDCKDGDRRLTSQHRTPSGRNPPGHRSAHAADVRYSRPPAS